MISIKVPLSLYRKQAYSVADDEMRPLRRWFYVRVQIKKFGWYRELTIGFGVSYA